MEENFMEEKKKNEFGKGLAIGGLVGLGLGIAGTCIAAAVIDSNSDDDYEPEIEEHDADSEKETTGSILGGIFKASEKESDEGSVKEESPIVGEDESASSEKNEIVE